MVYFHVDGGVSAFLVTDWPTHRLIDSISVHREMTRQYLDTRPIINYIPHAVTRDTVPGGCFHRCTAELCRFCCPSLSHPYHFPKTYSLSRRCIC